MLQNQLIHLRQRWQRGEIADAAYAALYLLCWQISVHGRRFASRRFKQDPRPDHLAWLEEVSSVADLKLQDMLCRYFARYNFLGVIGNVNAALCAWLEGRWSLRLVEHIPSPYELLKLQVQGERVVTVLGDFPRATQPVLTKANAFAFMTHDLEHAYKFFHDPDLHLGQRRFFAQVRKITEKGMLHAYMDDPLFAGKFHYLISDMNTHPLHSLHYLQAILIEFHLDRLGWSSKAVLPQSAHDEINAMLCLFDHYEDLQAHRYHDDGVSVLAYQAV